MLRPDTGDQVLAGGDSTCRATVDAAACRGSSTPKLTQLQGQSIETLSMQAEPKPTREATGVNGPHPSHITSDGSTRFAPLKHSIILAERAVLSSEAPSRSQRHVFRRADGVQSPVPRNDHENQILVYPGSFNPPLPGHATLLLHNFLSTDTRTIAAFIVNMDTSGLSRKEATEKEGKEFQLTVHQQSQLWQEDVSSRFMWAYPSEDENSVFEF